MFQDKAGEARVRATPPKIPASRRNALALPGAVSMIDARDSDRAHPIGTEKKPFPIPCVRRPVGQHRDTNCLTPFGSAQRRCLIPAPHRRPRTAPAKPTHGNMEKLPSVRPHIGRKAVHEAPLLEQCAASRGPPASLGDGMPAGIPDVC